MEDSSKPLATDSFSYSWLTQQKPSSSHDLPTILSSNSAENFEQNFDFDVPIKPLSSLVDADEIFSDGRIKPMYTSSSARVEASRTSTSAPGSPVSSINALANHKNLDFIQKWRKSYRRILCKSFGMLMKPLFRTLGCSRKSVRVVDLDRRVSEIQSLCNSLEASPRNSSYYNYLDTEEFKKMEEKSEVQNGSERAKTCSDESRCAETESSIQEAILYCKRSIEK